jgi:hypothetical protein
MGLVNLLLQTQWLPPGLIRGQTGSQCGDGGANCALTHGFGSRFKQRLPTHPSGKDRRQLHQNWFVWREAVFVNAG